MQLWMLKIQVFSCVDVAYCAKPFAAFQFTEDC